MPFFELHAPKKFADKELHSSSVKNYDQKSQEQMFNHALTILQHYTL